MKLWVWKDYISVFIIILFKLHFYPRSQIILTVINEYIRRFSWIYVPFLSCENVHGGSYQKIGDIPLTCTLKEILFNRKRSFYYSNQQTFCINNTRSLFKFCTQKHLSNVTHKRFLSHLANSNWFDYLESLPELVEMFKK